MIESTLIIFIYFTNHSGVYRRLLIRGTQKRSHHCLAEPQVGPEKVGTDLDIKVSEFTRAAVYLANWLLGDR
jgi:hypothetical protein